MSKRRRENPTQVAFDVVVFGLGVVVFGGVHAGVVGALIGAGIFCVAVFGVVFNIGVVVLDVLDAFAGVDLRAGVSARGQRPGSQAPAVPPLATRLLRWVRHLLPGDEGAVWWAEVTACLAETPDERTRRRYARSYRRNVPQLIWTSWTEHWGASRQRELS